MSEKGTNEKQRIEWVGDAALRFFVCSLLVENHPEETVEGLCGKVDFYINNSIISKFCKHIKYPLGANGFERHLAELTQQNDWSMAKSLVRQLMGFVKETGADKRFREMMISKTTHKGTRPVPCMCGSMNLRFWRKPSQVVCADCKRVFQPPQQPTRTALALITLWNAYRMSQRYPELEGAMDACG